MSQLTHFNESGRACMVDVSDKEKTTRLACASGVIWMASETRKHIQQGSLKKGNVLAVADVAAVMAAKRTPDLIPMCHPLMLSGVEVIFEELEPLPAHPSVGLKVSVSVRCNGKTGVEMEALTAVSAALLTVYDMCKSVDKTMILSDIQLESKQGGKSGHWKRKTD